jgi:hypothetical protein
VSDANAADGLVAFGRYRDVVRLCAFHEDILRDAAATDRLHGPICVRWWLGT